MRQRLIHRTRDVGADADIEDSRSRCQVSEDIKISLIGTIKSVPIERGEEPLFAVGGQPETSCTRKLDVKWPDDGEPAAGAWDRNRCAAPDRAQHGIKPRVPNHKFAAGEFERSKYGHTTGWYWPA
jgi:hypothetical protein